MCTRPLSILREDLIRGKYFDVVPCGRCPECLQRKQGEFAALAVLEAKRCKSLHFVTFTYNNGSVPIMFSYEESGELPEFVALGEHSICVGYCDNHNGTLGCATDGVRNWCPSLRRQDIRLFFKHCRNKWKYQTGDVVSFRYAGFGEYGGKTYRPHYHFLFYDMPDRFVNFMRAEWIANSGFCDVKKVSAINSDGSSGFVKVSRYISKYIAKPKDACPWIAQKLVEAPRRLSSRDFGTHKDYINQIKSYYRCEKMNLPSSDARLDRIIERTKTLTLDGVKFPFPRRIKEKLFYVKKKEEDGTFRLEKSALQNLVVDRKRVRTLADFNAKLRAHPLYDADENHSLAHLALSSSEEFACDGRETISAKNLQRKLCKDTF